MSVGADVLKEKFGPKKSSGSSIPEVAERGESVGACAKIDADLPPGVEDWKMKHLPDP